MNDKGVLADSALNKMKEAGFSEKEAIYALMHSLEDARDTFFRPTKVLGMGESEIIKEILYSHFKKIEARNLEQLEADLKKENDKKE